MDNVVVGRPAPQFSLPDENGVIISLESLLGKKVVLYFYPKDLTPGCTKESCDFRDSFPTFGSASAVIFGISKDSIRSHKKFKEKYNLPFSLLSDEDGEVCEKFEVWKEKSMFGRKYMGIERSTFVIDEKGIIRNIFRKVKVNGHVNEVLKALQKI